MGENEQDTTASGGERSAGGASTVDRTAGLGGPPAGGSSLAPAQHMPPSRADEGRPRNVRLTRAALADSRRIALWDLIQAASKRLSFQEYEEFMSRYLQDPAVRNDRERVSLPFLRVNAYALVKAATATFLETQCGIVPTRFPPFDNCSEGKLDRVFDSVRREARHTSEDLLSPRELEQIWRRYLVDTSKGTPRVDRDDDRDKDREKDRDGDKNGGKEQEREKRDSIAVLPYYEMICAKLEDVPIREEDGSGHLKILTGLIQERLLHPPMVEYIHSYWLEQGMLSQTMAAIARRFQNVRIPGRDPLSNLDLDPLRPLANLMWGRTQDERNRVPLIQRLYEYEHQYGITINRESMANFHPADSRSRFLEAFHNLLYLTTQFYREDDDTTIVADGFPVLNALKEVHLLLTEGAANQAHGLTWTVRAEMLIDQFLISRPEMRDFLGGRTMVANPERWMDRVDTMKQLQGWDDGPSLHYGNLATFGEQILLSIRYDPWVRENEPDEAAGWARHWRSAVQSYVHAYRAVTGADLRAIPTNARPSAESYLAPSYLIRNRMLAAQRRPR